MFTSCYCFISYLFTTKYPFNMYYLQFLPGESYGQRSLEGYSPYSHKESDMTEATCTHAHILIIPKCYL